MKRGRSTGNQTKAEAAWIRTVKEAGCICCYERGYKRDPDGPLAEAHHLLSGGIRIGHGSSVGLCAWHHRGELIVSAWTRSTHEKMLGPSLARGSVPFHAVFGDDEELMRKQNQLIALLSARAA